MPLKSGRLVRALEEAKDGERESEPPQLLREDGSSTNSFLKSE